MTFSCLGLLSRRRVLWGWWMLLRGMRPIRTELIGSWGKTLTMSDSDTPQSPSKELLSRLRSFAYTPDAPVPVPSTSRRPPSATPSPSPSKRSRSVSKHDDNELETLEKPKSQGRYKSLSLYAEHHHYHSQP